MGRSPSIPAVVQTAPSMQLGKGSTTSAESSRIGMSRRNDRSSRATVRPVSGLVRWSSTTASTLLLTKSSAVACEALAAECAA